MPEQTTSTGRPITPAPFEQPFETHIFRYGLKGINLIDAIDALEPNELAYAINVYHLQNGGIKPRPGQEIVSTSGGGFLHSVRRLNDPTTNTFTRIVGVDDTLYYGSGSLAALNSGYSGEPLSLVPYRDDMSGATWMYIGDSAQTHKVSISGEDLPIGLPAPTNAAVAVVDPMQKTYAIANDASQYHSWAGGIGQLYGPFDGETTVVLLEDAPVFQSIDDPSGAIGVAMQVPSPFSASPNGYYSFGGVAKNVNFDKAGVLDASDEDYVHLYLRMVNVAGIREVRVYFIVSEAFDPLVVPGTGFKFVVGSGAIHSDANTDAYVKTFSISDFANFIAVQQLNINAAEAARIRQLRNQALEAGSVLNQRVILDSLTANLNPNTTIAAQATNGDGAWSEFGALGIPLRRGDFQRIGGNLERSWSTITGMTLAVITGPDSGGCEVDLSLVYLGGGSEPDTGELADTAYDYRYTHYDTLTGAEGNPSPIMDDDGFVNPLRTKVKVTPTAYGYAHTVQRFYRRGGTLPTDWFFLGDNGADGAVYTDNISDTEAAASGTVETNNDRPVSVTDDNGNTLENQPLASLWGSQDDLLFGCGNQYAPGDIFFCKTGKPDSWPPENRTGVCAPSELLQAGCLYGGQSFVFSREKLYALYPNLSGATTSVTAAPTQCAKGMVNRWGLAVGLGGIYFISRDGIYRTVGGPEEWISRKIDPLFKGLNSRGFPPIDFASPQYLRLSIFENELWFNYKDTDGSFRTFIYNIASQFWLPYLFTAPVNCTYSDEGPVSLQLMGGVADGDLYSHTGTDDDGDGFFCQARTGCLNMGTPRDEKRYGDQALDLKPGSQIISLVNRFNYDADQGPIITLPVSTARVRAVIDPFGTEPVHSANISSEVYWTGSVSPEIYWNGVAMIVEPEITINRVTQWDDLGSPNQCYVTGITLDVDTDGEDREVIVEYDMNGEVLEAATIIVNTDGRHKQSFTWTGVSANMVRLRPQQPENCAAWILYKADWIFVQEPPALATWDIYFENKWDQYYTGLDLFCDTFGLDKVIQVYVDGTLVKTATINTAGRLVQHITLPWGRGHVFRFVAVDTNPGVLYDHRWQLDPEPSEQTNWNQNFSVEGIESDKYLKAIVFQCDTFGENKTVTVECDGVVVETLTVNADGRKVVEKSFDQHLGRVFRIYPTDDFPGRLYSVWWVFDQEPLALARWETQEIDHRLPAWHYPIYAHITLKSTEDVNVEIRAYNQKGDVQTRNYLIPSTDGLKQKCFVPFQSVKGVLFKYILTSDEPFWLYREETSVMVRVWGADTTTEAKVFGNDDLDYTRVMTKASLAAARSSGGTA